MEKSGNFKKEKISESFRAIWSHCVIYIPCSLWFILSDIASIQSATNKSQVHQEVNCRVFSFSHVAVTYSISQSLLERQVVFLLKKIKILSTNRKKAALWQWMQSKLGAHLHYSSQIYPVHDCCGIMQWSVQVVLYA